MDSEEDFFGWRTSRKLLSFNQDERPSQPQHMHSEAHIKQSF